MLDFNSNTTLSIPRPQQGLEPFHVDLRLAYEGEARLREIASVSAGTAPVLASVFSRAYSNLARAYGALYHEVASSTVAARKRRAHLILDVAPRIAKEKGLASPRSPTGSEDVREAICYQDEEYCAVEEYRAAIEAAKEFVFLKLQAMRMGYEAVRGIMRGTNSAAGNQVHDMGQGGEQDPFSKALEAMGVSAAAEANPPPGDFETAPQSSSETSPAPKAGGFGTPSYR